MNSVDCSKIDADVHSLLPNKICVSFIINYILFYVTISNYNNEI